MTTMFKRKKKIMRERYAWSRGDTLFLIAMVIIAGLLIYTKGA